MTTAETVVAALVGRRLTVATAESLTGGLVSAALTSVPGSSDTVRGGVVAYATDVKASVLSVDAARLAETGPVDAEVAAQMAEGARRLLGADVGVATTGVAGPGPSEGMPAGTVFIAAAGPWADAATTRALALDGDREANRQQTVAAVLDLLGELLTGSASDTPVTR
ncbi:CinA family protein [Knoellia subterranea]|uniref:Competence damage-inducible protein A n=1 Tax=Knoellia subterranea KCTC 19937 TaxID=1385521 RepID=A0A0A0JNX4_9MICO|nr:nicotinamide-nucleotide amidohydrolase family protein [Knoellia subterranea]KGN39105.1 competence damage-inducible protein A [Knoellia subterranea KCTC 19937]